MKSAAWAGIRTKGFETVTVAYQGELEHRDSSGGGGKIGAGDVQWMTAGNGIVHEEFHSQDFTRKGGTLQMVQLWVNLRAKDKSAKAGYQTLLKAQIPNVELPQDAGTVRVIAGEYGGRKGAAKTFTPIPSPRRSRPGCGRRRRCPRGRRAARICSRAGSWPGTPPLRACRDDSNCRWRSGPPCAGRS